MNRQIPQDPFSRHLETASRPLSYIERPTSQLGGYSNDNYSMASFNTMPSMMSQPQLQPLAQTMPTMKPIYNPNIMSSKPSYIEQARQSYPSESREQREQRKELGILFYSNNCSFCKSFLAELYKSPINDIIRKICVDKDNIKIPQFITSVPTLIIKGINRPLVGDQASAWLQQGSKGQGNGQGPSQTQAQSQALDNDLMSYSFNAKDNYTFIGETDDQSICNSLAEWNKDYYINAPIDTDQKEKKGYEGSSSINQSMDINRMRVERDKMIGQKQIPKATTMDPEKFNKMFLKQQQNFKQNIRNI
jgi:hypothetical protein